MIDPKLLVTGFSGDSNTEDMTKELARVIADMGYETEAFYEPDRVRSPELGIWGIEEGGWRLRITSKRGGGVMEYKPEAFEYWGDTLPKKIRMVKTVRADVPWIKAVAYMGDEHEVFLNQYGAVSVEIDKEKLGLKPNEFDVIERFKPTTPGSE